MLWTMHATPDPDRPDNWRMFCTGRSRTECGRVQRVGMARSFDLYVWLKSAAPYPLKIDGPHYESGVDGGHHWVSFRSSRFPRAIRVRCRRFCRRQCRSTAAAKAAKAARK